MGGDQGSPWHGKVTADSRTPDDQCQTDVAIKNDESISRSVPIPSTSVIIESLRTFIQELWKVVPVHYRQRMEQVWKRLDTENIALLGDIEEGARKGPSVLLELGVHAALRRLTLQTSLRTRSSHSDGEISQWR